MKKINRSISFILVIAFLMALVPSATSVSAAETPAIHTEVVGNVRVQVLSSTLVRAEVKGAKGFEDRKTFHIMNRDEWDGDVVAKSESDDNIVLTCTKFDITIKKGATSLSDIKIKNKNDGLLWKFSGLPSNKVFLPETNEQVKSFAIADTPRVVPSEWSFNNPPAGNTLFPTTNGWDLGNNANDMYIFLPESDHKQLRKDFVSLTGKTDMLPLSAFGAWDSRYHPYSDTTALQQIDDYHNRNLPLDLLVVDTDWRDASNGVGYDVNTTLFPDMEGFLDSAHDRNVEIMFNDHPEPTGNGNNNVLHPTEVNFRSTKLTDILKLGVDYWWYDRNWHTTIKPINGFTHEVLGMAVYTDAQKNVYPNRRPLMMSNIDGIRDGTVTNPSNIAAHRYSVQWTGDTIGGQEVIEKEVANTIKFGEQSALPYISADLGAHQTLSLSLTDTAYLRWMQMGALSPIFRPHVMIDDVGRMPWLKGTKVTDVYRDYVDLRYRLLPVFYQLANENYETGLPLLRSMNLDNPNYTNANRKDQYMLGEDILVAPVIQEEKASTVVPSSWLSTDGNAGIKAEYFNNRNLTGAPVTTVESNVNSAWGNASPTAGIGADNFSVRYTGDITIGSEDVYLAVNSDDGARLWIDGELQFDRWISQDGSKPLYSHALKAGTTHTIKLEYLENTGNAYCKLSTIPAKETSEERTVWIPEGEWIDTISGETVYGPKNITLECGIEDMPIFVKKGAVIPLAETMLTTKEKDWSNMALDVYPSTRQTDKTTIYEDDTESNEYKNGKFRTTALETGFENGKATLKIGASEGTFDGARAFANRNWTVRVHRPKGFGELTKITRNGTEIEATDITKITKDADAMPLNNIGGATDGDVYAVTFAAPVTSESNLEFEFASTTEPAVPADTYDTATVPFDDSDISDEYVAKKIDITETMPANINLTAEGETDWIFASNGGEPITKDIPTPIIQTKMADSSMPFLDYYTKFSWSDGKGEVSGTNSTKGLHSKIIGSAYQIDVVADTVPQEITVYIGGWSGSGKLEIFDDSDNPIVHTSSFTSGGSRSMYRKVTVQFSSAKKSMLHLRYSLTSGDNVTFTAATLKPLSGTWDTAIVEAEETISVLPRGVITKADFNTIKLAYDTYNALSETEKLTVNPTAAARLATAVEQYNALFKVLSDNLPASVNFAAATEVKIKAPTGNDIYYTIDESDPTTSATAIKLPKGSEVPIMISASTTIKCAIDTGLGFGEVATANYTVSVPAIAVKITGSKKYISVKGKRQLSVTVSPNNATDKSVKWTSSNKKIATVDSKGRVNGVKVGMVTITATTANGKKASLKLTIKSKPTKLNFSKKSISLRKNGKYDLKKLLKQSPTKKYRISVKYSWKSNKKKNVSVTKKGIVKAIKKGTTAKITVKYGKKKATITVKVKK